MAVALGHVGHRWNGHQAPLLKVITGSSGRKYYLERIYYAHDVMAWSAKCTQGHKFLMKSLLESDVQHSNEIVRQLRDGPNSYFSLPCDDIPIHDNPERRIIVFKYLTDNLYSLAQDDLSLKVRKQVLKACLRSIAEMHDKDIVHLDIRPHAFVVDRFGFGHETIIERLQLIDFDHAVHLPRHTSLDSISFGQEDWRSPEAIFSQKLNKPTDMFCFGAVCLYVIQNWKVLARDAEYVFLEATKGLGPDLTRFARQVAYFGDENCFDGLMEFIQGEEMLTGILRRNIWDTRLPENPNELQDPIISCANDEESRWIYRDYLDYRHLSKSKVLKDTLFKDLVLKMMSLDPSRRITAHEALEHPWFKDVGQDWDQSKV